MKLSTKSQVISEFWESQTLPFHRIYNGWEKGILTSIAQQPIAQQSRSKVVKLAKSLKLDDFYGDFAHFSVEYTDNMY